jgi:hypothetical protein
VKKKKGSTFLALVAFLASSGLLLPLIDLSTGLLMRLIKPAPSVFAPQPVDEGMSRKARVILGSLLYVAFIFATVFLVKLAWRLC